MTPDLSKAAEQPFGAAPLLGVSSCLLALAFICNSIGIWQCKQRLRVIETVVSQMPQPPPLTAQSPTTQTNEGCADDSLTPVNASTRSSLSPAFYAVSESPALERATRHACQSESPAQGHHLTACVAVSENCRVQTVSRGVVAYSVTDGGRAANVRVSPNDPSSATAATRRTACNRDAQPPFAAAHG